MSRADYIFILLFDHHCHVIEAVCTNSTMTAAVCLHEANMWNAMRAAYRANYNQASDVSAVPCERIMQPGWISSRVCACVCARAHRPEQEAKTGPVLRRPAQSKVAVSSRYRRCEVCEPPAAVSVMMRCSCDIGPTCDGRWEWTAGRFPHRAVRRASFFIRGVVLSCDRFSRNQCIIVAVSLFCFLRSAFVASRHHPRHEPWRAKLCVKMQWFIINVVLLLTHSS